MIKVTYLEHSGFALEYGETVLIFDHWKETLPEFGREKRLYVFASHAHHDHFNRRIFELAKRYANVTYVLSDDIKAKPPAGESIYMAPNTEAERDGLRIRTIRSTDEGVAFLIHMGDKVIYHAGDLNWWHWAEEDDKTWNVPMKRYFLHEMAKLEGQRIDVAFVPLDMRQEEQFFWGLDYFMRHTDTQCVFPIHMWDYAAYDRLMEKPESEPYREKVMHITSPGQRFFVEV